MYLMTERRYGFRFTAVEAGLLIVGVVLVSVFVFVAGVYVGKGVEAHKTAQLFPPVRMPVNLPEETRAPIANTPLTWKLPKDKPGETTPSVPSGTVGGSAQTPNPSTHTPVTSSPVTPTKKTTVTAVPPEEPPNLAPNKSQPKTV